MTLYPKATSSNLVPKVRFKLLAPDAMVPTAQSEQAAGLDLHAGLDLTIAPDCWSVVPTNIAIAIRPGYVGLVCTRSGLAARHGIQVLNAPGIIDSDYRGEIKVILKNNGIMDFDIVKGDRIAQLVIMEVPHVTVAVVEEFDVTARGEKGFGSTGI